MAIINEIKKVYKKYVFCRKEVRVTSHWSFTGEYDPTYSHFGLSQGINQINKHNHFKEIRG